MKTDKLLFALIDTEKRNLKNGLGDKYTDLLSLYHQAKEILNTKNESKIAIAHVPSLSRIEVLMPITEFVHLMEKPSEKELNEMIAKIKNRAFIRAYFAEVNSERVPIGKNDPECRRKIFENCLEILQRNGNENMEFEAAICKMSISIFTNEVNKKRGV